MRCFKEAGLWLGNKQVEDKVSAETTTRHLLASLLIMAWFVEARDPVYLRPSVARVTLCQVAGGAGQVQ